ncbi:MAG: hypothetical protein ABIR32_22925 [Ilumatobacteraceae bacterium]
MPPSNSTTLRDQRSIGSAAAATPIVEVDDQLRFAREFKSPVVTTGAIALTPKECAGAGVHQVACWEVMTSSTSGRDSRTVRHVSIGRTAAGGRS